MHRALTVVSLSGKKMAFRTQGVIGNQENVIFIYLFLLNFHILFEKIILKQTTQVFFCNE